MSAVERARSPKTIPPLVAGQHLDQPTFHERYEAMPEGTWAELVGGVVYMPPPVRIEHSEYDDVVGYWLVHYKRYTKGVRSGKNATVILDVIGETQPDGHLRIPQELGGRTRIERGYIVGSPELIVEIARSSREYDLHSKKADYERTGVLEYFVVELDPDRIHWFARRGKRLIRMRPGRDRIYRSNVFPGLWLDPAALYAQDLDRLIEVLEQGLATPEHAEFVATLARNRTKRAFEKP
jgi:Uma2 family endonuclease